MLEKVIYIEYLDYIYFLPKTSKYSFSRKKWRFLTLDDRKRLKTSSKKGRPIKNQRAKLGLS